MNLEYIIQSCKNEFERYEECKKPERNVKMCEIITTNLK